MMQERFNRDLEEIKNRTRHPWSHHRVSLAPSISLENGLQLVSGAGTVSLAGWAVAAERQGEKDSTHPPLRYFDPSTQQPLRAGVMVNLVLNPWHWVHCLVHSRCSMNN